MCTACHMHACESLAMCREALVRSDLILLCIKQEGSDSILLPEAKHSGFVPTPGKAIQLKDYPWYGDSATLKEWAGVLDEAEALYFQKSQKAKRLQR